MLNKGQIFSIDFLFAMILVIVSMALLMNAIQFKTYEAKDLVEKQILAEKTNAAVIALTEGEFSCNFDQNIPLAYSVDINKLLDANKLGADIIKQKLGLADYNIHLTVTRYPAGGTTIVNDTLGENTFFAEMDILACEKSVDIRFADLNKCLVEGISCKSANASKQKLTLGVSKK